VSSEREERREQASAKESSEREEISDRCTCAWSLFCTSSHFPSSLSRTCCRYGRLGLPEGSKEEAVKKHFKFLALKYHPDKIKDGTGGERERAAVKFQAISEAMNALTQ
jgi:DnaJ-class molecular chaperone